MLRKLFFLETGGSKFNSDLFLRSHSFLQAFSNSLTLLIRYNGWKNASGMTMASLTSIFPSSPHHNFFFSDRNISNNRSRLIEKYFIIPGTLIKMAKAFPGAVVLKYLQKRGFFLSSLFCRDYYISIVNRIIGDFLILFSLVRG